MSSELIWLKTGMKGIMAFDYLPAPMPSLLPPQGVLPRSPFGGVEFTPYNQTNSVLFFQPFNIVEKHSGNKALE